MKVRKVLEIAYYTLAAIVFAIPMLVAGIVFAVVGALSNDCAVSNETMGRH